MRPPVHIPEPAIIIAGSSNRSIWLESFTVEIRVNPGKKILTIEELAVVLDMKVREIFDGIKNGAIPFLRGEKRLRFSKQEVLEALNIKMDDGKGRAK